MITETFSKLIASLTGSKKLTEENIADAIRDVRLALLDADVSYPVVKEFVRRVKEKAVGQAVIKSVEPGQQFVKLIHDELVALMGSVEAKLELKGHPAVIMLCGLQGSGKTTQAAKLALYVKNQLKRKPLLVACDLQRPAAVEQLQVLGKAIDVPVLTGEDPVSTAKKSLTVPGVDVVILDTAGRLHIDTALIEELKAIAKVAGPGEVLLVANGALGQASCAIAEEFHKAVGLTGAILTMLDGGARAGAALSIREATGVPLKFEGIGEKVGDLQLFHPKSMADRILGMGDTINLVKKAKEHFDEGEAKKLEEKLMKATFTFEDYLKQMGMVKKMGSIGSLLKMLPAQMPVPDMDDKKFGRMEAMILSMTPRERNLADELTIPRKKRVARGSGNSLDEVNRLVKSFHQARDFFKNMPSQKSMEKVLGGMKWR